MLCPRCDTAMVASHREGVEIDTCPSCRGVWLDRGELEKIVRRADNDDDDREKYYRDQHHTGRDDDRRYKRKSFWSELFD
jgi:uncharacterized protein